MQKTRRRNMVQQVHRISSISFRCRSEQPHGPYCALQTTSATCRTQLRGIMIHVDNLVTFTNIHQVERTQDCTPEMAGGGSPAADLEAPLVLYPE